MTTSLEFGTIQPVQVHFDDLDAMGIVHNAKYAVLLERALTQFWLSAGWTFDPATSRFPTDQMLAVREFTISYHAPIPVVSEAAIHFWVERLGRSSISYGYRVLSADRDTVHAEGRRVQVKIDPLTRRPDELSPGFRAAAELIAQPQLLAPRQ